MMNQNPKCVFFPKEAKHNFKNPLSLECKVKNAISINVDLIDALATEGSARSKLPNDWSLPKICDLDNTSPT